MKMILVSFLLIISLNQVISVYTVYFLPNSSCQTTQFLSSSILSCIDEPSIGKVLIIQPNMATKAQSCNYCRVSFRAKSKTKQTLTLSLEKVGIPLPTNVPSTTFNKNIATMTITQNYDLYSISFTNPDANQNVYVWFKPAINNDISLSHLIITDQKNYLPNEDTLGLYRISPITSQMLFLQKNNVYDFTDEDGNKLNILAGQFTPNNIVNCDSNTIFGGPNQNKLAQKSSQNTLIFSITLTPPHYSTIVEFDLYAIDLYKNDRITVLLNGQECSSSAYQNLYFNTKTQCGNTGTYFLDRIICQIDGSGDVKIEIKSNSNSDDSVTSFGVRNFKISLQKCTNLCNNCIGPSISECKSCVANSYLLFDQCKCNLEYQPTDTYSCTQIASTNENDACLQSNSAYFEAAIFNFNCDYSNEKHSIVIRGIPLYKAHQKCLTYEIFPKSNPSFKITSIFEQTGFMNLISYQFSTQDMRDKFKCIITETEVIFSFICEFEIRYYYKTAFLVYSNYTYVFKLNKNNKDSISFFARELYIPTDGMECMNSTKNCTVNGVINTKLNLCENYTCISFFTSSKTFKFNDDLYLMQSIANTSLAEIYTLLVTNLSLICDGLPTNLPINLNNIWQNPGSVIIKTKIVLTGDVCTITLKSEMVEYSKNKKRVLQSEMVKYSKNKKRILQNAINSQENGPILTVQTNMNISVEKNSETNTENETIKWMISTGCLAGGVIIFIIIAIICLAKRIKAKKKKYIETKNLENQNVLETNNVVV